MKTIVTFFIFIAALNQGNPEFIRKVETIKVEQRNVLLLSPTKVFSTGDGFVWIDKNSIKLLSKEGRITKELKIYGRGPGEYQQVDDAYIVGSRLYIFDNKSKKVLEFEIRNNDLNVIREKVFNVPNNRNFTVGGNDNFFFLISHTMNPNEKSVIRYDFEGEKVNEYGEIPEAAALSRSLAGNGITYANNTVYYSYLGDPSLYKIDLENDEVHLLTDIPDYYTVPDKNKVLKIRGNLTELIYYAYEVSRIKGLFTHKNYVIQIVEDGGVRMEKDLKYYLEIWDNDKKIKSQVPVESGYIFSDNFFIYSVDYNDDKVSINKYRIMI